MRVRGYGVGRLAIGAGIVLVMGGSALAADAPVQPQASPLASPTSTPAATSQPQSSPAPQARSAAVPESSPAPSSSPVASPTSSPQPTASPVVGSVTASPTPSASPAPSSTPGVATVNSSPTPSPAPAVTATPVSAQAATPAPASPTPTPLAGRGNGSSGVILGASLGLTQPELPLSAIKTPDPDVVAQTTLAKLDAVPATIESVTTAVTPAVTARIATYVLVPIAWTASSAAYLRGIYPPVLSGMYWLNTLGLVLVAGGSLLLFLPEIRRLPVQSFRRIIQRNSL